VASVESYVVTVKTWSPGGTANDVRHKEAPGTAGLGEQFGDDGVRLTVTGFAPSVRICNDWVLGETYFGVIRAAVALGWIPIVNVTVPFEAFVAWVVDMKLCGCGRIADVPTTAAPPQPAIMATHSPRANMPLMRFVKKVMRTPY
jgi:hypothetical protein